MLFPCYLHAQPYTTTTMKRFAVLCLLVFTISSRLFSQYADLGTGALKDKIWWFDWNGFVFTNGATRTFTTTDGLTVTFTFSNVTNPPPVPSVMNTWPGAVLHLLYDFSNPNIKPAIYSLAGLSTNTQFNVFITATRGGIPTPFTLVAADAEACVVQEPIVLQTSGSVWQTIDFFRNSSQTTNPLAGCGTQIATISDTYAGAPQLGQNPVIASRAPASGQITVNVGLNRTIEGLSAIAFGLFSPVDRGDLPPSYLYAQHALSFTYNNPCNYLPPLPSLIQSQSLKLGAVPGDADATESSDDNAVGADEDAVSSFPIYNNNGSYSITVNLTNTTGSNTYLSGWFDYNRDGVFQNNERVINTIPNNATTSLLTWTGLPSILPPGSADGWGFRFRLSSDLNAIQNASGFAPDGEIEDYFISRLQNTIPDFEIPDTVCANTPVTITNTSTNATTSFWNFCSGSVSQVPTGVNMGNIGGAFSSPVFMDYVFDNNNYYGFLTNYNPGRLLRLNFGNSLLNTPTITDLGNFGGIIPSLTEGIQVVKNEGKWYAIIVAGYTPGGSTPRVLKIDFGANITNNTPTATNWGNIGNLSQPVDLHVFQENGHWYGFTVNAENNTITRFDFTTSFNNIPTAVNLGNIGNLSYPTGIFAINDNNYWRVFIVNGGNNSRTNGVFSLTRLDFGSSLLNTPTGVNLGNPNNMLKHPRDLTIMKFCGQIIGFAVNGLLGSDDIVKMDFNNDLSSVPTTTSLGNVGGLSFPHSISKIFRVGADLYSFVTNVDNNSLTRLTFTGCTNASIPNYSGVTPPPVTYSTPGTYNINLTIDDGLPTQSSICKQLVVKDCGRPVSGIINDYTEVLGFEACKNALTVTDASAYHAGDTVLIIQMKGAVIDSSNTAAFGTITDYKNAGNYEFNYIKNITGNVIELKNYLTRQYDIPDGKVQLIRVPYYINANITSDITCPPWDGGKGGVVVLNVRDTLTYSNGGVDVIYKGFRGGIDPFSNPSQFYCYENQYYYPPNPDLASGKGEGIASISPAKSFGKGPLANGGGGGNSHNSGGGGGGNASLGGFGGYNYELAPCNTTVPFDNRGLGGKALSYSTAANKIFMGGGGGAGHTNNPEGFQAIGGSGGGIAIISANVMAADHYPNAAGADAFGLTAPGCSGLGTTGCHEGMGGGGAGGTILFNVNSYKGNLVFNTKGGQGANMVVGGYGRLGPGGGGSGGVTWFKSASLPPNTVGQANAGGINGSNTEYANDPWGATPGGDGQIFFNLQVPIDNIPFKPNIDSVRIKDSITNCKNFDFKGFGFTNTNPITFWQWYFGDGNTANTQNTSHSYNAPGTYPVKLIVIDINGCKDSITKQVTTQSLNMDFSYDLNACNPLTVQFNATGTDTQNPYWEFGDANTISGSLNPIHTYSSQNTYTVQYAASNGVCKDTITKTITISVMPDDIILTHDTTICFGATKQLLTKQSLNFCWSPTTYLSDPNSPQPITSTPDNITYYFTSQSTGANLIVNGDFTAGNTGFTSQYTYANPNITEGQYFCGSNPQLWNGSMSPCPDHTNGSGNMMLVNGSPAPNLNVWQQTVTVIPNTNYAFSTWIQAIYNVNPAQLAFSINGRTIGVLITASLPTCTWSQFYTTWNSGANTTAVISIVNKNTAVQGNDFALDDISFAPVFIKRDSVVITVEKPVVQASNDITQCEGAQAQLNATGAANYSWSPPAGLNNPDIANPIAAPTTTTQYIVSGTTVNGCTAKDTVNITVKPKPVVNITGNSTICKNSSIQLSASGGGTYAWTPAATLSDPTIANPIASPTTNTKYFVTVTGNNLCTNIDSVIISIRPDPVFTINPPLTICKNDNVQLSASGGDIYAWQPDPSLNNPVIANPVVHPASTITYTVNITETTCNSSAILSTTVNVNPLPPVKANKSNDLDCSNGSSQLSATGATSYLWSPAVSLDNPGVANPVATPATNTQYIVKGTDPVTGCSNYDSVIVNFISANASGYYMPNAFTPNGDGLNDCYGIRYWGVIQHLEFSIYNRWGERIFFTTNPSDCWDGIYKGKMQDIGVYVYMIKAKTLCGETFRKGFFVLAR